MSSAAPRHLVDDVARFTACGLPIEASTPISVWCVNTTCTHCIDTDEYRAEQVREVTRWLSTRRA